jgi:serine protease
LKCAPIGKSYQRAAEGVFLNSLLVVDRHYVPFPGPDITERVGSVSFAVASTTSLPTLSPIILLLLATGLLATGRKVLRGQSACFAILFTCAQSTPARAQQTPDTYIEVLLSTSPGAATADDVFTYFEFSPPATPPPLQAFSSVAPQGAEYLIPLRARGDFKSYLAANSSSVRAKLERYLLVRYDASISASLALSSLTSDPGVASAYLQEAVEFSTLSGNDPMSYPLSSLDSSSQYGRSALNVDAAWNLAGGYAMVGDADTGLATQHPSLEQFSSNGSYIGGTFVPASSLDLGNWPNSFDTNTDEAEPVPLPQNSPCNPQGLLAVAPNIAGHGTHVAGLIAANADVGLPVSGTCRHCGIGMWKITQPTCLDISGLFKASLNSSAFSAAVTMMADSGIQIVNISLGGQKTPLDYCSTHPDYSWCLAITHANARGVALVGASGNARTHLQFPASDPRVIAVGGFDMSLSVWDESPGNTASCPPNYGGGECGSNYTKNIGEPRQELVASASEVLSTTYPAMNWNTDLKCGDSFGPGNGIGLCTGTSMSSPQIAGVVGILRSVNPLVPPGEPILGFNQPGIRTVLAQTTFEAQSGQGWTPTFGYGRPDAAAAAARMLGTVAGQTVKNRATPLFRAYSATTKDYADTTTPQMALTFAINQVGAYQPQGALVPGYASFPTEPNTTPLPLPRANVYVLTTEYKPRPEWPDLVPLYMIDRSRNFPVGCATGSPGCNSDNRDFTLVTTQTEIEQAHADGYNLRTIQGYVYAPCTPEPSCIPPGTQKFYRECRTVDDDCATFLESERGSFETNGYKTGYPGGKKLLGYAYPAVDSDNDGLIDGFEYAIGTRPNVADSDGDGAPDGIEFPMAGVAVSDPCDGPSGGSCPADIIFVDGFQHG